MQKIGIDDCLQSLISHGEEVNTKVEQPDTNQDGM